MLQPDSFFDLRDFAHGELFSDCRYVWEALKNLKDYMAAQPFQEAWRALPKNQPLPHSLVYCNDTLTPVDDDTEVEIGNVNKGGLLIRRRGEILSGASLIMAGSILDGGPLSLGPGVLIESGAMLKGRNIIGAHTEIRQGAYLRGHCLIGARCVLGHVTEIKHSVFLDDAKAGHFAYLGDTILGNEVNLGAGTKMANLRFTGGGVPVRAPDGIIDSGLRKFGAILGDRVQTGCNSVTNPGTLLGPGSMLMPNTTAPSGWHDKRSIIR